MLWSGGSSSPSIRSSFLISAVYTSEAATVPFWRRGPSNSGPSSSAKRADTLLRMPGSLRASAPGNQHLGETILRGNSGEAQWGWRDEEELSSVQTVRASVSQRQRRE